ncbi:MAG: hypothetical protein GAK45_00054 [Pseudomonas citronellolis]|nr:MAG: hypothetical protein GAK45_00054 [Pseudomonas citronellolis]
MKRLLPALLLLSPLAHAQVDTEIRCLVSAGPKPIRLEWRQYNDSTGHFSSTFVRYAHSDKPITLALKSSRGEELAEGRPWQFDTTWVEVVDGAITGQYHMLSQGARI